MLMPQWTKQCIFLDWYSATNADCYSNPDYITKKSASLWRAARELWAQSYPGPLATEFMIHCCKSRCAPRHNTVGYSTATGANGQFPHTDQHPSQTALEQIRWWQGWLRVVKGSCGTSQSTSLSTISLPPCSALLCPPYHARLHFRDLQGGRAKTTHLSGRWSISLPPSSCPRNAAPRAFAPVNIMISLQLV